MSAWPEPGTEIHFKFRAIPYIPIHERWTALITEFSFNEYFSDIQKQGPFKSWHHTHFFEAKTVDGRDGTVVGDEVEYEIGFGVVGTMLEKLIFQRMMARDLRAPQASAGHVCSLLTRADCRAHVRHVSDSDSQNPSFPANHLGR